MELCIYYSAYNVYRKSSFNGLGLAELGLLIGLDPPAKNLSGYHPTHCNIYKGVT
jgi:hypothetical protein